MENLTQNEIIILVLIFFVLYVFFTSSSGGNSRTIEGKTEDNETQKNNKKIQDKLEMMSLNMESLLIKKEEIENEINTLELEGSMDFEKERESATKIKKLYLQGRHLDIKITEMRIKIENLHNELGM